MEWRWWWWWCWWWRWWWWWWSRWSPARWRWRWRRFPPSGKEFPRQISLCRRAFLSLVFSASQRRRNMFLVAPRVLGFRGDDIRGRASPEVGQGGHTMPRRGLALARAWGRCGALVAPLRLSFGLRQSSINIWSSVYFLGIFYLPKYCILTALFPAESWLRQ